MEAANAAVVNYHHRLPLTRAFGPGTLSNSDGQRFPVKGKSITGAAPVAVLRPRAGDLHLHPRRGPALHLRHQGHRRHGTGVAHYVLDGVLGNATDLPITEHATDTHGASLANFALFDLVGKQLSPRIRDLGRSPCTGRDRGRSTWTATRGAGRC